MVRTAARECRIISGNPIYVWCMAVFPVLTVLFFTTMLQSGQPTDMPVGVVDQDGTALSRDMARRLDGLQASEVVAKFSDVHGAMSAMRRNEIYAFLLIPKGTEAGLSSSAQPKVSFYYSYTSLTAGALLYREMKTTALLTLAGAAKAKLAAKGLTGERAEAFVQPVVLDLHLAGNPWADYNVYVSTIVVPGVLMIFIMLMAAYSIGTELKFGRSKDWVAVAGGNPYVALVGKLLPQAFAYGAVVCGYALYVFGALGFPNNGGAAPMALLSLLSVSAPMGVGVFMFGIMPSLRMSMSVCSLWAVLGFTASGATFPIEAMAPEIGAMAQLFPLRHYYMLYQQCVLGGFPLHGAWWHIAALSAFSLLPLLVAGRIKRVMLKYVYIP